jgi:hypothetical protein
VEPRLGSHVLKPLLRDAEVVKDSGGLMDFFDLAARMSAGLDGVRACLLLSDDGLTLASYPGGQEDRAREVWDRLAKLGDPHRGFLDLGDEVWAVVRRGPYTAIVVSTPTVRPGLLLDRIESHLRVAEEARVRESAARPAASKPEVVRRPRTPLHRENGRAEAPPREEKQVAERSSQKPRQEIKPLEVIDLSGAAAEAAHAAPPGPEKAAALAESASEGSPAEGGSMDASEGSAEAPAKKPEIDRDIDRVALAREFSGLISDMPEDE